MGVQLGRSTRGVRAVEARQIPRPREGRLHPVEGRATRIRRGRRRCFPISTRRSSRARSCWRRCSPCALLAIALRVARPLGRRCSRPSERSSSSRRRSIPGTRSGSSRSRRPAQRRVSLARVRASRSPTPLLYPVPGSRSIARRRRRVLAVRLRSWSWSASRAAERRPTAAEADVSALHPLSPLPRRRRLCRDRASAASSSRRTRARTVQAVLEDALRALSRATAVRVARGRAHGRRRPRGRPGDPLRPARRARPRAHPRRSQRAPAAGRADPRRRSRARHVSFAARRRLEGVPLPLEPRGGHPAADSPFVAAIARSADRRADARVRRRRSRGGRISRRSASECAVARAECGGSISCASRNAATRSARSFRGDAFLRGMVRIDLRSARADRRGKAPVETGSAELLETGEKDLLPAKAAAKGLTLRRIAYRGEEESGDRVIR